MTVRLAPIMLALALLTGCSATIAEQPVTSPAVTPTPRPTAAGPAIQAQDASLQPVREAVPPVRVEVVAGDVDVDVDVVPVGVLDDGEMELPPDPSVAGWYRFGPDPGSPAGTTVVAAHVDYIGYGLGPFAALRDLSPGAEVLVTDAAGVVHRYAIDSVQRIPRDRLPVDEVFERAGQPRLVLITCGGSFDGRDYSDNLIVTASPA